LAKIDKKVDENDYVFTFARGLVEVLDNPIELSGQEVLPGFTLDLSLVWD